MNHSRQSAQENNVCFKASSSISSSTVKSIHQRIILESIYKKHSTSRTELSRQLHISKPAIADNLNALLAIGIVEEYGEGEVTKSGGRKPRLIRFNKDHKYIIAIDLNYKDPIFVLGNLNGDIINEFSVKITKHASTSVRVNLIKNAILVLLNSKDVSPDNLACIAISSPGVFPARKELSFANPQFKEWFDLDLPQLLSEEFEVNTLLKNDVNMAAYGELCYGAGRNSQNILYISCGTGIGAGLILDSKLFEGRFNSAGEIFNNTDPAKLACGTSLEKSVYIDSLSKKMQGNIKKKNVSMHEKEVPDFEDIKAAYRDKNPYLMKHLEDIAVELGCTVSNIANLLSIDTVIIGGEYVTFYDTLIDPIRKITGTYSLFTPKILKSELGRYSGIMGLFAFSREHYFDVLIESIK
jgi:predicted NBD/HSP70 family sugar kinase